MMSHKKGLYGISRRADTHVDNCQDSHFFLDYHDMTVIGVFDGCSDGINSHFASTLFATCFKSTFITYRWFGRTGVSTNENMSAICAEALMMASRIAKDLGLEEKEILTTAVISLYDKKRQTLTVKFLGDGALFVGYSDYGYDWRRVEFAGNVPDYPGYHLNSRDMPAWVLKQTCAQYAAGIVKDYSVCSDGVFALKAYGDRDSDWARQFLVVDETLSGSDAMLSRKMNILKQREKFAFDDDVTVVRHIITTENAAI